MPAGRPKKIQEEVKEEVKMETEKIEPQQTEILPFYEFEQNGKKYRKSFDEKGNSLGVVEL